MTYICFAAALLAVVLGLAAVLRKFKSLSSWLFFFGIIVLASESVFGGLSLQINEEQVYFTLALGFLDRL